MIHGTGAFTYSHSVCTPIIQKWELLLKLVLSICIENHNCKYLHGHGWALVIIFVMFLSQFPLLLTPEMSKQGGMEHSMKMESENLGSTISNPSMWTYRSHLSSLSLRFYIYKMGTACLCAWQGYCKIKERNASARLLRTAKFNLALIG